MPSTFTDKHGHSIWLYTLVRNPWKEGAEADIVAFNERDHLVLLDLHDDGGLTGFPSEELELLEPEMEKRIEQRAHVIERRQAVSLVGTVKDLVRKSSTHAENYKEAVPSTRALFEALETYLLAQQDIYEQMTKEQKELYYPGGTMHETEITHFFASMHILTGLSHVPHGDDPDL